MSVSKRRLAALLLPLALAACGKHGGAPEAGAPIVLHVADQMNNLQWVLEAAGEDKPTHYTIEWSNFLGGPSVVAAETGGSVDVGWMNETPLVFAQAAGSPVKVIAAGQKIDPRTSTIAIVVAKDSPIHSVADLRGKRVSYAAGTITQYLVVRALQSAGLSLADVHPVTVSSMAGNALANGTTDALTTADPMLSQMLQAGTARILVTGGAPLTNDLTYLVSPDSALADPAKSAAIGDFATRTARAFRWEHEHLAEAAALYAKTHNNLPLAIADSAVRRAPTAFGPIGARLVAKQQIEDDAFEKLGLVRTHVDASKLYDHRFDAAIARTVATP